MKKIMLGTKLKSEIRFLLLFSILFVQTLIAQDNALLFKRLNTSNGLSNNGVNAITQDSQGFLWIGTQDGLNQFDGYEFKTFRHNPLDSNSISSDLIFSIIEDDNGNLWVGTEDGLNYYNAEDETFTTFRYNPPNANSINNQNWNTITGIIKNPDNNLWVETIFKGLVLFNTTQQTFEFPLSDSLLFINNQPEIYYKIINDTQDPGNSYWIGCWRTGLVHYDILNKKIKRYKHNPQDKNSLSNDLVRSMYQDSSDILWIGTMDGLNKFDPVTETFTHYHHNPKNPNSLINNTIMSLYQDPEEKNILWIGTEKGLNRLNTVTNTFTLDQSVVNDPTTLCHNIVSEIYKDRWGVMWFGTFGGLCKMEPGRITFHNNINTNNSNEEITKVLAITGTHMDDNIIWLGTFGNGLLKLDRKHKTTTRYLTKSSDPFSANSDSIRSLYLNPQKPDILWVGTNSAGLFRIDLNNNRSKQYKSIANNENSLSSNYIRNIYETRDGMLWVTTNFGLNQLNPDTETVHRYYFQDSTYVAEIFAMYKGLVKKSKPLASIEKVQDLQDLTQSFSIDQTTKIFLITVGEGTTEMWDQGWLEDENGAIICKMELDKIRHAGGSFKNQLQIWGISLAPGNYKLRYKSDDSHSFDNWNAPAPQNPNLWGIQAFEINDQEYNFLINNIDKIGKLNSIANNNTSAILEDSDGMLWFGTHNGGLTKLDRKTGLFTNYYNDAKNSSSISDNYINALQVDNNGVMWVGTHTGINKYDPQTDSFTSYTNKDGLANNDVINILKDKNGYLWLATNNGISRFNPLERNAKGKLTFINYNILDGLQFNNYFEGSGYVSGNGEMFLGGTNGLTSFYPGHSNQEPPVTLITDFQLFNQSVVPGENSPLQKQINITREIQLEHDQNVFAFEFVALHSSSPAKNQYMYKMDGFDEDWIDGHRRYAPYTNLDPGKYTFQVKASNADGIWNDKAASIDIIISPPWWKTWYAYLIYVLLFVGLFWTTRRMELNRRKEKENKRILELENKRKTEELDRARQLQLSMLPKQVPQLPDLDIAVYMNPATEVGGDYYDFHMSSNGTLTVAVGDATGHGLNAGMMVTASKSLFETLAENSDLLGMMNQSNRVIRQMNLVNLKMAICLLKINGTHLEASGAGMPPLLIARKETQSLEEFEFNSMPLGSLDNFPYKNLHIELKPGDKIILMSDGFPERMDPADNMMDYPLAYDTILKASSRNVQDMVLELVEQGEKWAQGRAQDDDVTFVIIEVKQ